MAKVFISDTYLTNIADAIRVKNNTNTTYTPAQMVTAINSLSLEQHLPIRIEIIQSEHQTIKVVPTVNPITINENTTVNLPTINLNATVVPESGYEAGTLNQELVTAQWGSTINFSATAATEIADNILQVYDISPRNYDHYVSSNPNDIWDADYIEGIWGYVDMNSTSLAIDDYNASSNTSFMHPLLDSDLISISSAYVCANSDLTNKFFIEATPNIPEDTSCYMSIYYASTQEQTGNSLVLHSFRENISIQDSTFQMVTFAEPPSFTETNNEPMPINIDNEEDYSYYDAFFIIFSRGIVTQQEFINWFDNQTSD